MIRSGIARPFPASSGTLDTSGAIRYFVSAYLSRIGLPHRDSFETPTIERLVEDARRRNDRRGLRLFGIDEGFHRRQQAAWRMMMDDDRRGLKQVQRDVGAEAEAGFNSTVIFTSGFRSNTRTRWYSSSRFRARWWALAFVRTAGGPWSADTGSPHNTIA